MAAVDVAEESFVTIQFDWALLAWVTPSLAHGGTAELFGAHDTLKLTLTHVIVDLRETRSRSIILIGKRKRIPFRPISWQNMRSTNI